MTLGNELYATYVLRLYHVISVLFWLLAIQQDCSDYTLLRRHKRGHCSSRVCVYATTAAIIVMVHYSSLRLTDDVRVHPFYSITTVSAAACILLRIAVDFPRPRTYHHIIVGRRCQNCGTTVVNREDEAAKYSETNGGKNTAVAARKVNARQENIRKTSKTLSLFPLGFLPRRTAYPRTCCL